jgi:hypothetical protein
MYAAVPTIALAPVRGVSAVWVTASSSAIVISFARPKIEDLHGAVIPDDDVSGFEVAMDDATGMSGRECGGDGNLAAKRRDAGLQWTAARLEEVILSNW